MTRRAVDVLSPVARLLALAEVEMEVEEGRREGGREGWRRVLSEEQRAGAPGAQRRVQGARSTATSPGLAPRLHRGRRRLVGGGRGVGRRGRSHFFTSRHLNLCRMKPHVLLNNLITVTFRTLLQRRSRGVEAFVCRVGGCVLSASWRQTGDMLPSRLQLAQRTHAHASPPREARSGREDRTTNIFDAHVNTARFIQISF
ncbi:hypothetical protein EYF80_019522 [Liparis tanakae]|uniref:Uncharacterized protein n=1 Tax=Liparis tanakae TaxID=230148 RepID=A0A4Z2HXA4_9TELE|nr:hypothetical protein EYF80_019522 [Liparis tanakae]